MIDSKRMLSYGAVADHQAMAAILGSGGHIRVEPYDLVESPECGGVLKLCS